MIKKKLKTLTDLFLIDLSYHKVQLYNKICETYSLNTMMENHQDINTVFQTQLI